MSCGEERMIDNRLECGFCGCPKSWHHTKVIIPCTREPALTRSCYGIACQCGERYDGE